MITGCILTHLLYCSSIFHEKVSLGYNRRNIEHLQRRSTHIVSCLYRTCGLKSGQVLAYTALWDLIIISRSIQFLLKKKMSVPNWGPFQNIQEEVLGQIGSPTKMTICRLFTKAIHSLWKDRWTSSHHHNWMHQLIPTPEYFRNSKVVPIF